MILKVLGSSSKGNCYLLENDKEALIIEAGLPIKEVKIALDFNVSKIAGVIATHCHSDHAGQITEYEKIGFSVFKPYESEEIRQLRMYGSFIIRSFKVEHSVPCHGFLIENPEIGKLLFVTDTQYIKWRFENLNHIMIEANYSDEFLEADSVNKEHVLQGHMSIKTALRFIEANNQAGLRNVVLLHLSEKNSDSDLFKAKTEEITKAAVNIATRDLEVDLSLCPF